LQELSKATEAANLNDDFKEFVDANKNNAELTTTKLEFVPFKVHS
jgi:hypothetical protein